MPDLKQQEIQQELFEEFSKESKRVERIPPLARTQKPILFSTTLEHLLLAGIALVLALCLVFFLGVLRGKSLSSKMVPIAAVRPVVSSPAPQALRPAPAPVAVQPRSINPATPVANAVAKTQIPAQSRTSLAAAAQNASAKPYTIQLVTHKKRDIAENEAASLKRSGFYSFIMTSGEYYLVCVGQYASKEEAKKDLHFFNGKFKDCFLRRR